MPIRYLKPRISLIHSITASLIGLCFLQAPDIYAAEYQYLIEATARAEQIENPRRGGGLAGEDDPDEFLSEQRLRGTLTRATSKLVTNIDYQGSKYNYRENLLTDRTFVTGASSIDWLIVPDRLTWNVSNSRSLQVIDPLLPDTLDNRQVIGLTSTGPGFTIQLSGRNKLSGSANYSIAEYEMAELSGQDRISGNLLLSHNFTTSFISSLGGNYLQSEFDDIPIFDFERYEYFWQNEYVTEIANLNLMLGQTVLSRINFDDQENILIRLTGNYKLNSQSTLEFNYSDSYEDIFSNMVGTQLTRVTPTQPIGDRLGNSNLNQNFELVQKGIGYIFTKSEFFSMDFRYSEAERTYQDLPIHLDPNDPNQGNPDPNNPDPNDPNQGNPDPNNQNLNNRDQADSTFHVGANWTFFENLSLNIYGRYTEQEFTDIDREQERNEYGLQAGYRISKSLYAQFGAFSVDQSGTLPIDDYDGLNYWLSLTLSIGNQ